jgi:hypothetical protein
MVADLDFSEQRPEKSVDGTGAEAALGCVAAQADLKTAASRRLRG